MKTNSIISKKLLDKLNHEAMENSRSRAEKIRKSFIDVPPWTEEELNKKPVPFHFNHLPKK